MQLGSTVTLVDMWDPITGFHFALALPGTTTWAFAVLIGSPSSCSPATDVSGSS